MRFTLQELRGVHPDAGGTPEKFHRLMRQRGMHVASADQPMDREVDRLLQQRSPQMGPELRDQLSEIGTSSDVYRALTRLSSRRKIHARRVRTGSKYGGALLWFSGPPPKMLGA